MDEGIRKENMKSYNHLWEEFISEDNIKLAIKNAFKGKKKKCKKARRIGKKEKVTAHEARQILSYMGYIDKTDTYGMYEERIKPYVNVKSCKHKVSKFYRSRKKEAHDGVVKIRINRKT